MRLMLLSMVAFSLLEPRQASAQQPAPPPAREVKAEFAFVSTSGNADTQTVGVGADVIFRRPVWIWNGKAAFVRNESNNAVTVESLATLARAARVLTPRLQTYAQHGFLRDRLSGIRGRNTVDAGLSYGLLDSPRHTLFVDGGVGYMKEQRLPSPDLSTAIASTGARYRLRLSPTSDFTDDLLFASDFSEQGTWRVLHTAALTARIVSVLSMKLSNVVRFVNEPVPGFDRTDTLTSAALVLSF